MLLLIQCVGVGIDVQACRLSYLDPTASQETFADEDDRVFYEVALSKEEGYVVTGNTKHFPKSPIVVTPAEMMQIIQENYK